MKLRITTTEAYSLVLEAFDPEPPAHPPLVIELNDPFTNEAGSWSGYIHGEAQDLAGFDIPTFLSGTLPAGDGEIPCTLVLPDGEHDCLLIQWETNREHWKHRGLICLATDEPALKYARERAKERSNHL